jgi:hypothetical protein
MRLTGNTPLFTSKTDEFIIPKTSVKVFLPTDETSYPFVYGEWELEGDSSRGLIIGDMQTPIGLRRQGISRKLTQSLLRISTTIDPSITTVLASCSSPNSLRIIHGLFPDTSTIWLHGAEPTPDTTVTISEALGIMALYEPIPEAENDRAIDMAMVIRAELAYTDMNSWQMPVPAPGQV